jgi:SAM-dependent methyltransferase
MTFDEYYTRLGLTPLDSNLYMSTFTRYGGTNAVEEYKRLFDRFQRCGDYESTQAFYQFLFTTEVPGLGCLWSDAFHRAFDLHLDRVVFPKVELCCADAAEILDAGCGDGILLCYMAIRFPDKKWVGVDVRPEAIELARKRIDQLSLTNVTILEHDVFELAEDFPERFDCAILRNVVDDAREAWSDFHDGKFNAVEKLSNIRRVLKTDGRAWLSLTFPVYSQEREDRLTNEIRQVGFVAGPAEHIPYRVHGTTFIHLAWTLQDRSAV